MSLQVFTTKRDIERIIEIVIERIQKTDLIKDSTIDPADDRLSQKEAAAFLGISVTSIIQWKKKGKIPYYQIASRPFFSKKELLDVASRNSEFRRAARR